MLTSYCADELRWRPFELSSTDDVTLLNELFASGWRIEPVDVDGLPFLAFCGREGDSIAATIDAGPPPSRLLVILQRAKPGAQSQRAVFVKREISGYIDLSRAYPQKGVPPPQRSRGFVAMFPIGPHAVVSIFEVRDSDK